MPIHNIGQILSSTKQIGGNAAETAVAKSYLVAHVNDFDRVEIEVRLGTAPRVASPTGINMQRWADFSLRPRADMICWRGNVPTIVECKERIDGCAIGQLLLYTQLLKENNPTLLQTYKIAAGISIIHGASEVFWQNGVEVELYPSAVQLYGS